MSDADQAQIVTWLVDACRERGREVPIDAETHLLEPGFLDSLQFLHLVHFIEGALHVEIDVDELVPENFATPKTVSRLVERLRQSSSTRPDGGLGRRA